MRHIAVLLSFFLLAGCVRTVYERQDLPSREYYYERLQADIGAYVARVDREVRLEPRQRERIERLLESRTRHLLEHTRRYDYPYVYPFPRGERQGARRVQRGWWRDADQHIARVLTERQADRYWDLARSGRLNAERADGRVRRRDRD